MPNVIVGLTFLIQVVLAGLKYVDSQGIKVSEMLRFVYKKNPEAF